MLNQFRSMASGFAAKILLILLVLSFAVWGIEDMLRAPSQHLTVATVGSAKITREQLARTVYMREQALKQMMGERYSPEMMKAMNLPQQMLSQLINQLLLKLESKSLGLIPSDADVVKAIRSNPRFIDQAGVFDKATFEAVLRSSGMSEKAFIEQLREDMGADMLREAITSVKPVSEQAVQSLLEIRGEKRNVTLYTIGAAAVGDIGQPDASQLKEYYDAHGREYVIPEYRLVSYVVLTSEDVTTLANKLEDALAGGSTLAEAAKELGLPLQSLPAFNRSGVTQDGSRAKLPDLEHFLDTAFKTDEQRDSSVVSTKGGTYYLLHVDKVIPEKQRPLEEVKESVVAGWKKYETEKKLMESADELSKKFSNVADRISLIAEYRLASQVALLSHDSEKAGSVSLPPQLVSDVFSRKAGTATEAYPLVSGGYVFAVVDSLVPLSLSKKDPVIEKLRADIRTRLAEINERERLEEYAAYLSRKYTISVDDEALRSVTVQ